MQSFLLLIDPWIIAPYRWTGSALAGFYLGTALLSLQVIILGDLVARAIIRINRKRMADIHGDMEKHHALSEEALKLGDKESFKAVNRQALEAFGHSFSMGAVFFCVSVWPLPFALAWMQLRFGQATPVLPWSLPLLGKTPGIVFYFLLLYIPIRVFYSKVMARIFPGNPLMSRKSQPDI